MRAPGWISKAVVLTLHKEQLAEHGGASGIRDEGLLDSALSRPLNLFAYGEPDLCDLAAAYAFGLANNHPFFDGNKRISNIAAETFLLLNGKDIEAEDDEKVRIWLALAFGGLTEQALADWLRAHLLK